MSDLQIIEGKKQRRVMYKKVYRWEKKRPKSRSKVPSVSKLMKEADRLFSLRVRAIGADSDDINTCFTCEKRYPIKKLQCGHFLSRYYKAARWDFDNARPQCMMCNMWKKGDPITFRKNLIAEIGLERVEKVEAQRAVVMKLTKEFLEEKIAHLNSTHQSQG